MTNVSATTSYNPILPLVGRILIGLIFLVAGIRKLWGPTAFAATVAYLSKLGFPAPEVMAGVAILLEVGGAAPRRPAPGAPRAAGRVLPVLVVVGVVRRARWGGP